jgi:O-antigen/teichoic acid export membrane protein
MVNLRRSLVINFFSSSGAALLQFLVSVLLARMLSPSEIGVYSMTLVFVNFAHVFRDFGVSTYLKASCLQRPG